MIDYEKQYKIKKRNAEYGYALVWIFALILIIVLPIWLERGASVFQIVLAAGALIGIIIKIYKGIKLSKIK
ncbi:MAG: hypothetical protein ACOCXH_13280 [Cyclobacteriaceae bacterium]